NSICVPLSNFTLWLVELTIEAWVLPWVAELSVRPGRPIAPLLALVRFPCAVSPPATPPAVDTVPLTPLVAAPVTVCVAPDTVPVAVDATPPTRPPPERELPPPEGAGLSIALSSKPLDTAACAGGANACSVPLKDISCPPFKTALSKTIPNLESACSLLRAWASVTWPNNCDPFRTTTLPSAFTSCVTLAVTSSPGLALRASRGLLSSACTVVPLPSTALLFTPETAALPAVLLLAPAVVWEPLFCSPFWPFWLVEACAEAFTLAEAPGACTLWLAFAPADAWPGLTATFPEVDPLALCATAVRLNNPAVTTNFQKLFMFLDSF